MGEPWTWVDARLALPPKELYEYTDTVLVWAKQHDQEIYGYELAYYCYRRSLWYFPMAAHRMTPLYWMSLEPPG